MDSHFEVILERVKQLSETTQQVVWFELYNSDSKCPSMVLINQDNVIGLVTIEYTDNTPDLCGYMLSKDIYDKLVAQTINFSDISVHINKRTPVKRLVKQIANV